MEIQLIGNLTLDEIHRWLPTLTALWERFPDLKGRRITLNLEWVTFVSPVALSILAATILRLRQKEDIQVILKRPRTEVDTYLNRMDFYALAEVNSSYPWQRHDAQGRFREIVQVQDERDGDQVVGEIMEILQRQRAQGLEGVKEALEYALSELVNNVFHHAHSPIQAIVCAQAYPNRQEVEVAVVDMGKGIANSLARNPGLQNQFRNDAEAIGLAIRPRVTGRPDYNTGEGLFFTTEFVRRNNGFAYLRSYHGELWIQNGSVHPPVMTEEYYWPGTCIAVRFRMDHPIDVVKIFNYYAPPEQDYEWIFDEDIPF